jgi:hypothetical protein
MHFNIGFLFDYQAIDEKCENSTCVCLCSGVCMCVAFSNVFLIKNSLKKYAAFHVQFHLTASFVKND